MKKQNIYRLSFAGLAGVSILLLLCLSSGTLKAQVAKKTPVAKKDTVAVKDTSADAPVVKKKSYVKNTFEGNYLIDEQTVMVPIKGTFEFDIQHRFGTVEHGTTDLFGI